MVDIRNETELRKAMEDIIEKVIDNVSFKVSLILNKYIMRDVYTSHPANKYYHDGTQKPTYQFLSAFKWDTLKRNISNMTRELFYDWQSMKNDPDTWLHGSNVKGWPKDAREYLAEWLNKDGFSSSLWISVEHKPYWNNFLDELFNSGKLSKLFEDEFRKYKIRKI